MNDYHAFNSTSGKAGGSGGGGLGAGWIVIVIVILLLIFFLKNGADWDAIDCLLGFGLLALQIVTTLFR